MFGISSFVLWLYFFIALCQSISLTHSCLVVYMFLSRSLSPTPHHTSVSLLFALCCLTAFTTPFSEAHSNYFFLCLFFFTPSLSLFLFLIWTIEKHVSQLSWHCENQRCYPPEHTISIHTKPIHGKCKQLNQYCTAY